MNVTQLGIWAKIDSENSSKSISIEVLIRLVFQRSEILIHLNQFVFELIVQVNPDTRFVDEKNAGD